MSHGYEAVVVAPEALAADAGVTVFEAGGNVFDAAVATALAEGVVNPQLCGIGGFGAAVIATPKQPSEVIQFYGTAGSKAMPDIFAQQVAARDLRDRPDGRDVTTGHVSAVGYKAIVVPGTVMGLHTIWKRYGSLPWADLCRPAIQLAAAGFNVTDYVAGFWSRTADGEGPARSGREILTATAEAARIYTRDGAVLQPGDRLVQADLARTLERIATGGADEFYHGWIAEVAAADLEANGALVTREDFRTYAPRSLPALGGSYRGFTVAANPPPGAGFQILQVLNVLEGYDLHTLGHNSAEYVALIADALRRSFTDRRAYLGDPDFVPVPVERLITKEYAAEIRRCIAAGTVAGQPAQENGTTHLCIMDSLGNAIAMTHSLGSSAGVVTPGLGFLYNNCMAGYSTTPGLPNSIGPGKRRVAGSIPTILFRESRPVIAIGSPGGPGGMSGTLQVILNMVDFGMSPSEAVLAPRFHLSADGVLVEASFPSRSVEGLERAGRRVRRVPESYGQRFGRVQVARTETRGLTGASDPRSEGGYRIFRRPIRSV